jgi:hypothetical protein
MAAAAVRYLKRGAWNKADVMVVSVDGAPVVVKDFGSKGWAARWLGRLQVGRELRAYRWLGRDPAVPGLVGRVDPWALALEYVEGEPLAFAADRFVAGERFVASLRLAVDRFHAAGVFHQDLRGRENVLVRPGGDLVLLDLAGAVCLRPGGLTYRLFRPLLRLSDESAFLKWKALLTPGRFTREEEAFLRRFRALRPLWIFNRKAKGRSGEA